jgi:hypothetical protein
MAMHIDPWVALFAVFSLILVLYPLWQALGRRSVEGIIAYPDGLPLPRATVKLTNLRTADVRVSVTGEDGRFHFDDLQTMSDYEISVAQDEQWSQPVRIWQYAYRSSLQLQMEPPGFPLIVLHEEIGDPYWWGVG